ncbi:MAG TPA: SUF system NifU family Fe-S cluster assembly protein [Aggregatilineales bacterium]|nr:SUF system NifU family Fe-S cluster assembly protein [Anaerolineales bacterium]HRE49534.1 SUF system NifU family Fe-S cluster assembly protein [Aggregatilineales bacterium]
MDRQAYIENILDHYEHPRNRGAMDDATVSIKGGNPGCGDIVTLYLKIDDQERITAVSFEGEGCTISQAAASMLTEMIIGQTLTELSALSPDDFVETLGREVVVSRPKCATLALNTAKAAERKYRAGSSGGAGASSDEPIEV